MVFIGFVLALLFTIVCVTIFGAYEMVLPFCLLFGFVFSAYFRTKFLSDDLHKTLR